MTATLSTARKDIYDQFTTVWTPTGHPVHFPGVADKDFPPATQIPWARLTLIHATGTQSALANHEGVRRFTHTGTMTVQIFTPLGRGGSVGYPLAQIVVEAFQGSATINAVWFRNVRVNEIGVSRGWYQINVLADFEYDQLTTPVPALVPGVGGGAQPITLDPIV